jgi:uncharacterized protein YbbK (DUF523 family)
MPTTSVLVSKCLLGHHCQYDGAAAERQVEPWMIERFNWKVVPVCPEELAGLSTPRDRVELQGGSGGDVLRGTARAVTIHGDDVTAAMVTGASAAAEAARRSGAMRMIGRRRSPSCSPFQIADGTFSGRLVDGEGVTAALLRAELGTPVESVEQIVTGIFTGLVRSGLATYREPMTWSERRARFVAMLRDQLPLANPGAWADVLRDAFREVLPLLHESGDVAFEGSDSDTARFVQEACREAFGFDLVDASRRCRICTYPEGFLDVYLSQDGVCSACALYGRHKAALSDYGALRRSLDERLDEVRGRHEFDAVVACSGGKDSTYMLYRLCREYRLRVLCVMDDLGQQNDEAIENLRAATRALGVELAVLAAPEDELSIRRNFLRAGSSFCRLCLRSHLIRVYQAARERAIPFVFIGLSPFQLLDCEDAIRWSLAAIQDVATPPASRDRASTLQRYRHRAFQGGFDVGFVTERERALFARWQSVFDADSAEPVPLMVPFFLFEPYPDRERLMETISRELGWKRPAVMFDRTNCRLLGLAGIVNRAVGRHHMNYKERAARLRFDGVVLTDTDARNVGAALDRTDREEGLDRAAFEAELGTTFGLAIEDLPAHVRAHLLDALS